jgi:hypothetical protein
MNYLSLLDSMKTSAQGAYEFLPPHHRVSFFSSRRNWHSPKPSPAGECAQFWGGGAHSLAREGLGEPQFRRGDIPVVLFIYTYFVLPIIVGINRDFKHVS